MIDQKYPIGAQYSCRVLNKTLFERSVAGRDRAMPCIYSPNRPDASQWRSACCLKIKMLLELGGDFLVNTALDDDDVITLDPSMSRNLRGLIWPRKARIALTDELTCNACGATNRLVADFCHACGARLQRASTGTATVSSEDVPGWMSNVDQTFSAGMDVRGRRGWL